MDKRLVALIGNIIAASAIVIAALIARQSVKSYREQRTADNESYREQRAIDRQEEVAKRQREAYEHYFQTFWNVQYAAGTPQHKDAQVLYQTARDNLFFYASDEGLRKVSDFHEYIVRERNKDQDTVETLFASMVLAVRKDFYGDTGLTVDEIKSRLTIEV